MILCLHPEAQTGKCELKIIKRLESAHVIMEQMIKVDLRDDKKKDAKMGKLKCSVFFLVLLIFGCNGLQLQTDRQKITLFDKTTRAYDLALRWGEFENASTFIRPSDQNNELPDIEDYRDVRISAVKVKNTVIDKESISIARRVVDIQYYRLSNVTVKNIRNQQVWEYNEEEDRWYLTNGLPVFK